MNSLLALMSMDLLWRNALGAIPLAIAVAIICGFAKCRPSTRHALWLIVLLSLLAPPLLPSLDVSDDVGAPQFFAKIAQEGDKHREAGKVGGAKPQALDGAGSNERAVPSLKSSNERSARAPGTAISNNPTPPNESAASTASERSPTPLRRSASHPPSSETGTLERSPVAPRYVARETSPQPRIEKDLDRAIERSLNIDESAAPTTNRVARSPNPEQAGSGKPLASSVDAQSSRPVIGWLDLLRGPNTTAADAARSPMLSAQSPAVAPEQPHNDLASAPPSTFAPAIEWRDWLYRVAAVRDSIVTLAPIPSTLWLAGVLGIILVMLIRVWRFNRVLRKAIDADSEVVDLVQDCADAIGLRTMPRVLMTDRSVSPLVWCGVHRVLLLPSSLWRDLDESGRRAVLLHELAHLKRRDHWVCWVEMIACTIYWWNPLAWWVRHRLRDEADYCCDAWVTAVLPESRTAYARALLATKQFLNSNPSRVDAPSMALGATSARTKRFARRLTMVMTDRTTPRMSLTGTAAAFMLAGAAWLATPLWACPPEDSSASSGGPNAQAVAQQANKDAKAAKEKALAAEKAAKAKAGKGKVKVVEGKSDQARAELEAALAHAAHADMSAQAKAELEHALHAAHAADGAHGEAHAKALAEQYAAQVHAHAAPGAAASTFESHMAGRGEGQDGGHAVIAQAAPRARSAGVAGGQGGGDLEGRIDRLEQRLDRLTAHLEQLLSGGGQGSVNTVAPRAGARGLSPTPPAAPSPPAAPARPRRPAAAAEPAQPAPPAPGAGGMRRVAPSASVGGGMSRAAPAPEAMQDSGETIIKFYPLPDDMGPALFAFMRRDDVKVFVAARDDGIEVHGSQQQHRIFAAFVKMIYPEAEIEGHDSMAPNTTTPRADMAPRGEMRVAEARRAQVENEVRRSREQVERQRTQTGEQVRRQMEQARKQMEQQRKQVEQQRKTQQKQVEELMKKSGELQRKAEEMREKAESLGEGDEMNQLLEQAEALDEQAEAMEEQAEAREEQIEEQMEAMEEQLEEQLEALEEQLAAQEEALEEQLEAQEEAMEAELEAQMAAIEAEMSDLPPPSPEAPDAPTLAEVPTPPAPPAAPSAPTPASPR